MQKSAQPINAALLGTALSKQAMRERAKAGRAAGGDATPAQAMNRLSDTLTDKRSKPKTDTRKQAAKQQRVPERKVRQAQALLRQEPALAAQVSAGVLVGPGAAVHPRNHRPALLRGADFPLARVFFAKRQ